MTLRPTISCSRPHTCGAHRVNGTRNYIWHLFDKLEDLRPILKEVR